ncbi:MAG: FxLYD domain-containing protein [Planctomycetota bacterium]|jgi:hypothetical protein
MNNIHRTLAVIVIILAVVISGCSNDFGTSKTRESDSLKASRSEHDREGDSRLGEEVEESGTQLALNDTYDKVRNGVRLTLTYDAQSNSFIGTVENTTDKTLKRVRVEVHLSNGKELGPTTPTDLGPGKKREVKLTATNKNFDGWTAHPEVGSGKHGHYEGRGEHDREGRGEHESGNFN